MNTTNYDKNSRRKFLIKSGRYFFLSGFSVLGLFLGLKKQNDEPNSIRSLPFVQCRTCRLSASCSRQKKLPSQKETLKAKCVFENPRSLDK